MALRLGLTSFGGPVAHLGYFREEYVVRRKWLSDRAYVDLVALCQFLPGPASSQVGVGVGYLRAGLAGSIAAWVGFTLPSALLLFGFAAGVERFDVADAGWPHGLKVAVVAVVANAVWGMAKVLTPDWPRAAVAVAATVAALSWETTAMQLAVIVAAGLAGWLLLRRGQGPADRTHTSDGGAGQEGDSVARRTSSPRAGLVVLAAFFVLLAGLPLLRQVADSKHVAVADSFYRSGSLVFGGGHVVLPLLQAEVVPQGWVTNDQFTAGYGLAQAAPGPLFSFAAYLAG